MQMPMTNVRGGMAMGMGMFPPGPPHMTMGVNGMPPTPTGPGGPGAPPTPGAQQQPQQPQQSGSRAQTPQSTYPSPSPSMPSRQVPGNPQGQGQPQGHHPGSMPPPSTPYNQNRGLSSGPGGDVENMKVEQRNASLSGPTRAYC